MNRGGGVHTVPSPTGSGWWNKVDGKVLSRHRTKDYAVEVGGEIARRLRVEHDPPERRVDRREELVRE